MAVTYPLLLGGIVFNDNNNVIRMTEGAVTSNMVLGDPNTGVAMAAGSSLTLFASGDGTVTDLCRALKQTFDAHTNAVNPNTYTVTPAFSIDPSAASGTVAVAQSGGSNFGFLFANAATTFDATLIGFPQTDTAVNTPTKTSTKSPGAWWMSPEVYELLEPIESYEAVVVRAASGRVRASRTGGPFKDRTLSQKFVDSRRMNRDDNTSDPDATLAKFIERFASGSRFRFFPCTVSGFVATLSTEIGSGWLFDQKASTEFAPQRMQPGLALYNIDMRLLGYVA